MKDLYFLQNGGKNGLVTPEANDIEFDGVGFVTVSGPARVEQAIKKILSTALGSNPVMPTYGSVLPMLPGTAPQDVNALIVKSVRTALALLIEVEESQDPSENIDGIVDLTVSNTAGSPNAYLVNLVVSLVDGSVLPIQMGV